MIQFINYIFLNRFIFFILKRYSINNNYLYVTYNRGGYDYYCYAYVNGTTWASSVSRDSSLCSKTTVTVSEIAESLGDEAKNIVKTA